MRGLLFKTDKTHLRDEFLNPNQFLGFKVFFKGFLFAFELQDTNIFSISFIKAMRSVCKKNHRLQINYPSKQNPQLVYDSEQKIGKRYHHASVHLERSNHQNAS